MTEPPVDSAAVAAPEEEVVDDGLPRSGPRISSYSILWSVLLSLAVLVVIGYFTFEPESFRRMLPNLNPWLLAAAALTVVLRVLFSGWRLNYVSHGRLGLLGALRGQLAWDFFSNVTPSTIGGAPFAAAYISRDSRLPLGETTAIMLFSMLLDQIWFALSIPLILIATLYFEVIPHSLGRVGAWSFTLYFLGLLTWVLLFSYATFFRPQLLKTLVDRICRIRGLRRFREAAMDEMRQLQARARILRTQPAGFYLKGFLLTLATWFNRYVIVVLIIWSVYPSLDKILIFLRTIALTLGSFILPTPGGAGGLEGLYALMLPPPVVPEALVVPTLLTWRLLAYYLFIAIGAFLTMDHVQRTLRRKKRAHVAAADGHPDGAPVLPASEPVERAE